MKFVKQFYKENKCKKLKTYTRLHENSLIDDIDQEKMMEMREVPQTHRDINDRPKSSIILNLFT